MAQPNQKTSLATTITTIKVISFLTLASELRQQTPIQIYPSDTTLGLTNAHSYSKGVA